VRQVPDGTPDPTGEEAMTIRSTWRAMRDALTEIAAMKQPGEFCPLCDISYGWKRLDEHPCRCPVVIAEEALAKVQAWRDEKRTMLVERAGADTVALAGEDFVERLLDCMIEPIPPEVAAMLADGPEVSGGLDVEPEDVVDVEKYGPGGGAVIGPVYVVTVFGSDIGGDAPDDRRTWMWLPSIEMAERVVLGNECDIFEGGTYRWAVVEEFGPGFVPKAEDVSWFRAELSEDRESVVVTRCEKPEWANGMCNWGMG
jgi:hypothetical protein